MPKTWKPQNEEKASLANEIRTYAEWHKGEGKTISTSQENVWRRERKISDLKDI